METAPPPRPPLNSIEAVLTSVLSCLFLSRAALMMHVRHLLSPYIPFLPSSSSLALFLLLLLHLFNPLSLFCHSPAHLSPPPPLSLLLVSLHPQEAIITTNKSGGRCCHGVRVGEGASLCNHEEFITTRLNNYAGSEAEEPAASVQVDACVKYRASRFYL